MNAEAKSILLLSEQTFRQAEWIMYNAKENNEYRKRHSKASYIYIYIVRAEVVLRLVFFVFVFVAVALTANAHTRTIRALGISLRV